jgi:hypothetical protein
MAQTYVSDVRLKSRSVREKLVDAITKSSTFCLQADGVALNGTGDIYVGVVLEDCEFIGGFVETSADEGTDGDLTIEHWDDLAGSTKTTCSLTVAIDAGAAAIEPIGVSATAADNFVGAGYRIVIDLGTGVGNAITGEFCLYFRTVSDRYHGRAA